MLTKLTLMVLLFLFSFTSFSQEKDKVYEYKKVTIDDKTGEKTLVVKTRKNGKTEVTELQGEAVDEYLKENPIDADVEAEMPHPKTKVIVLKKTEDGKDEQMTVDIEKIVTEITATGESIAHEISTFIDSAVEADWTEKDESIVIEESDGGKEKVIIIKDENAKIVEEEIINEKGEKVKVKKIIIEEEADDEKGDVKNEKQKKELRDVQVSFDKKEERINISYVTDSGNPVKIEVKDKDGKELYKTSNKSTGKRETYINVKDKKTNHYDITIEQNGVVFKEIIVVNPDKI